MGLYTYLFYIIKRERRLKRATLCYNTITSEAEGRQPECEDESIDCPECYDTMIRFYDWDSIRYVCENCDFQRASESLSWIRHGR